jgi:hypothetical protein
MLIIDGSNLLWRAFHSSPTISWQMYSYLFSRIACNTIKNFHDKEAIVCWDHSGSFRRKRQYGAYKEKEKIDLATPEGRKRDLELREYCEARHWLHLNLPRMGIQSMLVKGIEADDIAYWLVTSKLPEIQMGLNRTNYLISSDKDWNQIINEYWWQYDPIKGTTTTYSNFIDEHETKDRFIFKKALLGDPSDNIPKCYGMGNAKVDQYTDKLLLNESIVDSSVLSQNLQEFIASGQFTTNISLIDFSLLGRGERRQLHIEFVESRTKVKKTSLLDWIQMAKELDSKNMIDFGSYFSW